VKQIAVRHDLVHDDTDVHVFFVDDGLDFAREGATDFDGLVEWVAEEGVSGERNRLFVDNRKGIVVVVVGGLSIGEVNDLNQKMGKRRLHFREPIKLAHFFIG